MRLLDDVSDDLLIVFGIAILFIAVIFIAWWGFLDIQHFQTLVTKDDNGVYKTWQITHHYEEYESYRSCSTANKITTCRTKYHWSEYNTRSTTGLYRLNPIIEPERDVINDCGEEEGCQRIRIEAIYRVRLQIVDTNKEVVWCSIPYEKWNDGFVVESLWWINRNRFQGFLCHTLQGVVK